MKIGIVPNIDKTEIIRIVNDFLSLLDENNLNYIFSDNMISRKNELKGKNVADNFSSIRQLGEKADIIVSFGGDGTMLSSAYELRGSSAPMLGINLGKLGFLAEYDMSEVTQLVRELKDNKFVIDERMALSAYSHEDKSKELYAINDLVIDKGRWPKMIEMAIRIDDDYVTTFSADGVIIATPTGSTGYSLSTGGPIVNPKSNAITLSPISPHTLTMRPLVLSSEQKIQIEVRSPFDTVQVNCDGQRVHYYKSPLTLDVFKSDKPVRLIHSKNTNYFEILRNKLYWGLDIRKNNSK